MDQINKQTVKDTILSLMSHGQKSSEDSDENIYVNIRFKENITWLDPKSKNSLMGALTPV